MHRQHSTRQSALIIFLALAAPLLGAGSVGAQTAGRGVSQASGSNAATTTTIDAKKCSGGATDQLAFKNEIIKAIRGASSQRQKPALGYELPSAQNAPEARQADVRASAQAELAARTLFAAIYNPAAPADAASKEISHDPRRRGTLEMYARCPGQGGPPQKIVQNQNYFVGESGTSCPGSAKPVDMGMNVTQVFQTNMAVEKVKNQLVHLKTTSEKDLDVKICLGSAGDCKSPDSFQSSTNRLDPRRTFYIQDTMTLATFAWHPFNMVNRTAMKVSSIPVCGGSVYLATEFSYSNEQGFDRSSTISVIASIGGKTIIVGQMSAQSFNQDSYPITFAKDHFRDVITKVFGSSDPDSRLSTGEYNKIAKLIGSTERAIMGEISGGSQVIASEPTEALAPGVAR